MLTKLVNPRQKLEDELRKRIYTELEIHYLMTIADFHAEMRALEAVHQALEKLNKDLGEG